MGGWRSRDTSQARLVGEPFLFVYGTLAPGRPNEHVLADVPGLWQPARVNGTLLPRGWGAALGYPAIRLDDSADAVEGLLFTSDELDDHWDRLDDFEGDGYERVATQVRLLGGSHADAFIYVVRELNDPHAR